MAFFGCMVLCFGELIPHNPNDALVNFCDPWGWLSMLVGVEGGIALSFYELIAAPTLSVLCIAVYSYGNVLLINYSSYCVSILSAFNSGSSMTMCQFPL